MNFYLQRHNVSPCGTDFFHQTMSLAIAIENTKVAELDFHTAPPEYKTEGAGWHAVFNTSIKRVLDVQLVHNFMHERYVCALGREVDADRQHRSVVCCVKFSPTGKYLATGCNGGANIYDVKTGVKKW